MRQTATRKLKRPCITCGQHFKKGDVYYRNRSVFDDYQRGVIATEYLQCAKCKFHEDDHDKRFEAFKLICTHPMFETIWEYIYGEAVMEPDHTECVICRKWI